MIIVVIALKMYITAMPAMIMLTGETFLATESEIMTAVGTREKTKALTTVCTLPVDAPPK